MLKILEKLGLGLGVIIDDKLVVRVLFFVLVVAVLMLSIERLPGLGLLLSLEQLHVTLGNNRDELLAKLSLLKHFLFKLVQNGLNMARLLSPFLELDKLNKLERLSRELLEPHRVCTGKSSRLRHRRGQQIEGGSIPDGGRPRTILTRRQTSLGKVAMRNAAVFDEQLLHLELPAAAVHRTFVHLVLELVEALLASIRKLEGRKLFPIGPAVGAEARLQMYVVVGERVGGGELCGRVSQRRRVVVAAHDQLRQRGQIVRIPLVRGRVWGATRLAGLLQLRVVLVEQLYVH